MKNLKIRTKLLLGFGSVISLLLVVAIVVTSTNLVAINNVQIIDYDSKLQTYANDLRATYINTRIPANNLTYTVDPAVFDEFKASAADIGREFDTLYNYITENPILEKFRDPLKQAETAINTWIELSTKLGEYNEMEVTGEAQITAISADVASATI